MFQKNPFTMVGTIAKCWLFTFSTPIAEAKRFLPPPLEPVMYRNKAFWGIVVSQLREMRPQWLPPQLGMSYWHVAHRIYAQFQPKASPLIEGLYFVRSDCNSQIMTFFGNLFTDLHFHTSSIAIHETEATVAIQIESSTASAKATIDLTKPPHLPSGSVFASLDEAASFLKYKPNGISIQGNGNANVVHITRREEDWCPKLVHVRQADWSFFNEKNVTPEICYQMEPIFYQWNQGRIYPGSSAMKSR